MAKTDIIMQMCGKDYDVNKITAKVEKTVATKAKGVVKDLRVYVKPEDGKAYFTYKEGKNEVSGDIAL